MGTDNRPFYMNDLESGTPYRMKLFSDKRILLNVQERAAMGINELDLDHPGSYLGIDQREFD